MNRFLVFLSALAILGLSAQSEAAGSTATVSWTAPVNYTDGTVIPNGDIANYTVTWTGAVPGSKTVTTTTTTVAVPCGSASFTVTVTTSATAKYPNSTSVPSAPPAVYNSGITCGPNAPTGVNAS